jgi:hypothetical protein
MRPNSRDTTSPAAEAASGATVEQEMHVAYELLVHEVLARPLEKLEPINVNVGTLLLAVLGAIPRIAPHRPTLALLPTFDIAQVDDLQLYALALAQAHGLRRGAAEPPDAVTELARLQKETRDQLLVDAGALARRGLLDQKRIAKLARGTSYLAIAFDVVGLVGLFLERWHANSGKTGLSLEELEMARKGASQLVAAIGYRQQSDSDDDPDERIYRELFSRLNRAYSDVRRALTFIRRNEGDADRIAPSAYRGRPKSSGKAKNRSEVTEPVLSTEAAPPSETAAAAAEGSGKKTDG